MFLPTFKRVVPFCLLSIAIGTTSTIAQYPSQKSATKRTKKPMEPDYMRPLIQPDIAKYFRSDWLEGQYGLPKADQIVSMKAEIYQARQYGPDIDRFEVPKEQYQEIISLFNNSVIETDPTRFFGNLVRC